VESTTYIVEPTILRRRDEDEDTEAVAYVGAENALLVFRSADEVAKFRERTGMYPGFEAVAVDEWDIGCACVRHGLSAAAFPEPWTGDASSGVDFFDAEDFVRMLRESVPTEE
jgi:hypothetical protein